MRSDLSWYSLCAIKNLAEEHNCSMLCTENIKQKFYSSSAHRSVSQKVKEEKRIFFCLVQIIKHLSSSEILFSKGESSWSKLCNLQWSVNDHDHFVFVLGWPQNIIHTSFHICTRFLKYLPSCIFHDCNKLNFTTLRKKKNAHLCGKRDNSKVSWQKSSENATVRRKMPTAYQKLFIH